jgi:hypothetical protein
MYFTTYSTSNIPAKFAISQTSDVLSVFYNNPFSKATSATPSVKLNLTQDVRTILFYTDIHDRVVVSNPEGIRVKCGQNLCHCTSNKKYINQSHAVVFDGWMRLDREVPLALRSVARDVRPDQWWIYYNREATRRTRKWDLKRYDPVFNWTMTYKLDSDILYRYSVPVPGQYKGGYNSTKSYLEGRTKTAIAFISNCYKPRLAYISKLKKYLDIDVFGRCGKSCGSDRCWPIINQYKFFLAFENAVCKDYITEKTYSNALGHDLIPVILSGANLSNPIVIPPHSYVSVKDFSNLKDLAKHLKYIGNNATLYNEYFKWRTNWNIVAQYTYKNLFCSICEKVHNPGGNKWYNNVYDYFNDHDCSPYPI